MHLDEDDPSCAGENRTFPRLTCIGNFGAVNTGSIFYEYQISLVMYLFNDEI